MPSELTELFDRLAVPALAPRMGEPATLRIGGSLTNTLPITVIVERIQDQSVHQTTSTPQGRNINENVYIDVLTAGVKAGVNDAIQLDDGEVAQVIRPILADPDGFYQRLACNVPGSITSKSSHARP
jgi:hypothetical protein